MKSVKGFISLALAFAIIICTGNLAEFNVSAAVDAMVFGTPAASSYWSGTAASKFADGNGTQNNPYIIETADQLYKMVSSEGKLSDGTSAYYKVADGVSAFYLNEADSLSEIKTLVSSKNYKNWQTSKNFYGVFDGNGVTVYGMVSYDQSGFIYGLRGNDATVKNVNFDSCYVYSTGNAAVVTTRIGNYLNAVQDLPVIANVSVRNVYVQTARNISVSKGSHSVSAGGLVSTGDTPKKITMANCFFDGYSSELVQGSGSTADATAGIYAGNSNTNNVTLSFCVSLGAQVLPQAAGANYTRYAENNNSGFQVFAYNCYCDLEETVKETAVIKIDKKARYEIKDMPSLDWLRSWQLVEITDGVDKYAGETKRLIPMTKANSNASSNTNNVYASYNNQIADQINGGGAFSVRGGDSERGTYGMYYKLTGSGTADDPYLIYNAFELARAVASGGVNVYNRLYYKLACDIDASDAFWISQDSIISKDGIYKYKYVAFNGVLDGDGHTVSGVFAGDDQSVGLIPILDKNGVVKNIHIRNSCFVSGDEYAGAVAGEVMSGAEITGCSAENCLVVSNSADSHIVGKQGGRIENSYYIADDNSSVNIKTAYYNTDGVTGNINVEQNSDVWYIGGADGSLPKLKNYAAARQFADIDGDGEADEYTARDLTTLRCNILSIPNYQSIYGDINGDGVINISDIAILSRQLVGSYDKIYDGFWRNAELGKINIYYGENDNYDAARRLEIYLEQSLPGVDIKKFVSANKTVLGTNSDSGAVYVHGNDLQGKPKGTLEIIVGNIENYSAYSKSLLNVNDYTISYNNETGVLWFNGGSFTGVEQAVIDFINNSDKKENKVYTIDRATLVPEKRAKAVKIDSNYDGVADKDVTVYYAWGDEFNGVKDAPEGENDEISLDTWNIDRMNSETIKGEAGNYRNVETANEKEISKLYWVKDGKLSITRGVVASSATQASDELGYVRLNNQTGTTAFGDNIDSEDVIATAGLIKTDTSMLYKQGYAEMYGSLPSDGHTFASWWLLGHGAYNNTYFTESLYSKVYKLNNTGAYAYDGTSNTLISASPRTFKYQIPTTYFEIDIWELMQNNGRAHSSVAKYRTTGTYDYGIYLNVHKFYSVGANGADTVSVINWQDPANPRGTIAHSALGTGDDYYFSTSAGIYGFTNGSTTRYTKNLLGWVTANYVEELQRQLTAPRRYGFYWSSNGTDKFSFTLYIYDVNGDGVEGDDAILCTSNMVYNEKPSNSVDIVSDAETANQYMYMLFDNILYSSNEQHSSATSQKAVMFTDLLTNEGTAANPDKISLEVDYTRVYQLDGRRDIVTKMTEDFNNGNHFGY